MATSIEFIEYVCEQVSGIGIVRYRKMFGEYMVYINDKPILLVCDNTVFVKELECIKELMKDADRGVPYPGSKEHYVLNIDDPEFCKTVIAVLEPMTPLPNQKKSKHSGQPGQSIRSE